MSKRNRILAIVQVLIIVSLMLCNGGVSGNLPKKYDAFPCKDHQCGCKSESDCKTHCCCVPDENLNKFSNNSEKQNRFKTFISSINCKYGNDPLTTITFTAKYILERQVRPIKESFLCFLSNDTSFHLPEAIVSPPEKPPRYFV